MRKKLLLPAKLGEGKLSFWHFWDDRNNKIIFKAVIEKASIFEQIILSILKRNFYY